MSIEATVTAPSGSSAAADLAEDRLTSWVPDVAADADLATLDGMPTPGEEPEVRDLRVPLPTGGSMQVPVVHPRLLLELHRATAPLRDRAETLLSPDVLGYRHGARADWHYAPAWREFSDETARRASRSGWVAFTDVASCFASTSWQMIHAAVARHGEHEASAELADIARRFQSAGLPHLPSGYSDARFLSNLVLSDADDAIGVPFLRWVDDYRLFASTRAQASAALERLHDAMRRTGLEPNERKTRIVPGAQAAEDHQNTLASVYHPDRDPPEIVRENLHRVFFRASEDPVAQRRQLRFSLARMAREEDPAAIEWACEALARIPWEAPRLASYLTSFAGEARVGEAAERTLLKAVHESDAWMVARLVPLTWHTGLSETARTTLAASLHSLTSTPAWGLTLRLLAHLGEDAAVRRSLAQPVGDRRAMLVALCESGLEPPSWLSESEPALAAVLRDGPVPAPTVESLL